MKIMFLNSVPYGSTGRIMFELADALRDQGHQVLCTAGFTWRGCRRADFFLTSGLVEKQLHTLLSRLTGRNGCYSRLATWRLIRRIRQFGPDVIHLHNLHGWYLNLPMLFRFLRTSGIKILWTLHDCWAFTGKCPHFQRFGCDKWQSECHHCPQLDQYPPSFLDNSRAMHRAKRRWFSGLPRLQLIVPSRYLADQVGRSFLRDYPRITIPNGIDLGLFSPDAGTVRPELGIRAPYLVLGVALGWDVRKGLDVFLTLAPRLGPEYQLVLAGQCPKCDLPENVMLLGSIDDPRRMAQLYASADLLLNPTREDTFPTVNLEALACGTPVVTFPAGGSPESLDSSCGIVIEPEDLAAVEREIRRICTTRPYSRQACRNRALAFDRNAQIDAYLAQYLEA